MKKPRLKVSKIDVRELTRYYEHPQNLKIEYLPVRMFRHYGSMILAAEWPDAYSFLHFIDCGVAWLGASHYIDVEQYATHDEVLNCVAVATTDLTGDDSLYSSYPSRMERMLEINDVMIGDKHNFLFSGKDSSVKAVVPSRGNILPVLLSSENVTVARKTRAENKSSFFLLPSKWTYMYPQNRYIVYVYSRKANAEKGVLIAENGDYDQLELMAIQWGGSCEFVGVAEDEPQDMPPIMHLDYSSTCSGSNPIM
ncbi:MAG: hypothetical protein JSS82_15795 [Bacteroidetes bacterium]|nr:hypothetical protein [Bacteroidota bacterium]